jgi:hypothetical protein
MGHHNAMSVMKVKILIRRPINQESVRCEGVDVVAFKDDISDEDILNISPHPPDLYETTVVSVDIHETAQGYLDRLDELLRAIFPESDEN